MLGEISNLDCTYGLSNGPYFSGNIVVAAVMVESRCFMRISRAIGIKIAPAGVQQPR